MQSRSALSSYLKSAYRTSGITLIEYTSAQGRPRRMRFRLTSLCAKVTRYLFSSVSAKLFFNFFTSNRIERQYMESYEDVLLRPSLSPCAVHHFTTLQYTSLSFIYNRRTSHRYNVIECDMEVVPKDNDDYCTRCTFVSFQHLMPRISVEPRKDGGGRGRGGNQYQPPHLNVLLTSCSISIVEYDNNLIPL